MHPMSKINRAEDISSKGKDKNTLDRVYTNTTYQRQLFHLFGCGKKMKHKSRLSPPNYRKCRYLFKLHDRLVIHNSHTEQLLENNDSPMFFYRNASDNLEQNGNLENKPQMRNIKVFTFQANDSNSPSESKPHHEAKFRSETPDITKVNRKK